MQAGTGLPVSFSRIQFVGRRVEDARSTQASFRDEYYKNAGADVTSDVAAVYGANVVLRVRPPSLKSAGVPGGSEVSLLKPGSRLISYIQPAQNAELLDSDALRVVAQRTTAFAMDQVRACGLH